MLIPHPLLPEEATAAFHQLFLPLGDLGRMHLILARKLAERLVLFERLDRHLEFELGAPTLPFLGHASSTCVVLILADLLYFACGLDSGTNHKVPVIKCDEQVELLAVVNEIWQLRLLCKK